MGSAVSMAKVWVLTLLCVALVASAVAAPYDFEDEPRSSSVSDVAFEAEDEPRGLGLDEDDEDSGFELDNEEPEMRDDEDDEDLGLEPEVREADDEGEDLEPEPEASDRRSEVAWKRTSSSGLRCLRFIGRSLRCAQWDTSPARRPRPRPRRRPVPWWFRMFPWWG